MTEEEKARLVDAKAEVTAWLSSVRVSAYKVSYADPRIGKYIREVADHPEAHNLWEQLAVRRFLQMCGKYGLDTASVSRFFYFYEHLKFPGKKGDQCYELTPVQCFQFASIFGFWENGRRVVREACLFVPRKFSKTTSTASLAVWDMLFGEHNGEAYVGANSADQAHKCFDVIRGVMRHLDPSGRRYQINQEVVRSMRKDRSAFAQCLTANANTKDGLNASVVIMDEFSQARDNRLLTVLTTSMGVRDNPLTVIITTASDVFDGPFYSMLQGYKQLLLGDWEDDSVFAHLFEPDVDDAEDSPTTWRKVHPHLGVTVGHDFYEREYKSALRNGADAMLAFRTKLLNLYAENERRSWIGAAAVREVMRRYDPTRMGTRLLAMIAIDLSESDDFSAVTISHYQPKGNIMYFHTAYFFPRGSLSGHPNEALYRKWAEAGHLRVLDGEVIDYDAIVAYIIGLIDTNNVQGIGYDPYKSQSMVNDLRAHPDAPGADTVLHGVGQTFGNFTAPVETFEHGLKTGHVVIDDNPITAWCFGNAVLCFDKNENCKPMKRTEGSSKKIDGVITMLMCVRQWIDLEQSPTA